MSDAPGPALAGFHPLIAQWFLRSVGQPTEVQEKAWPAISRGAHVLVSAPTGTGKTLAAFLWGIDRLVTGALRPGKVRILYVSPLKALNNDIQRNLLGPLSALADAFRDAGETMPPILVLTRSGDTPASDRRRMLRAPPQILITTPESLNLMLSSANARMMLDGVATVILDEIHAVAAGKRGTHLMTGVDRLALLAGEFQRIALSATVKPLSAVADLIGGYALEHGGAERGGAEHGGAEHGGAEHGGNEPVYRKRRVEVVHCPLTKVYNLRISFPAAGEAGAGEAVAGRAGVGPAGAGPAGAGRAGTEPGAPRGAHAPPHASPDDPVFDAIARRCRTIIDSNRSTLFFVNSRRHAEKLARFINEGLPEPVAWAHHGSLSRELRLVVERRLKAGELKAIVATSSLELGIDIGALDQVVLVQTPFTVASAVQRLGRAGHRVGEASRGVLFPLHGKDIVDAAVTARCVREQDIEEITPVVCPLDVLAQVLVSMTSVETWTVDALFDAVRAGFSFHTLSRRQFDLVLDMLAGRYEETRLRDLSAMVSLDRLQGTVRAKEGARIRLVTNGGTIPDRGYFSLRMADTKSLIGELDEEFVWERSPGDSFIFGTQGWRIQSIDSRSVEVVPVQPRIGMSPFWKAEERNRGFHLSERIALALEAWSPNVGKPGFPDALEAEQGLDTDAAQAAAGFLARQREATGTELPHRHHLLVEHTRDPDGRTQGASIVLHTMWGGRVNRPFGLALSAAWEERFGYSPEMIQNDDALLLQLPEDVPAGVLLSLVDAGSIERLLKLKLEGSGFFGARFREGAGRALLLPRATSRGRTPLWLTRQRAKSLYAAVARYDDFPILLEAWRTCLRDEFDLPHLSMLLDQLESGAIRVTEASTPLPSPFCGQLVWKQTNTLMYADDTPPGAGGTSLRADLVRELALSPHLRPRIAADTAAVFQAKLQRTAEGYAPRDARELVDWVKERVLLPREEWEGLLAACARDYGLDPRALGREVEGRVGEHTFGEQTSVGQASGGEPIVCAVEVLPRLERARGDPDGEALEGIVAEWLRFYGPLDPSRIAGLFGVSAERADALIADLAEQETVVIDRLRDGSPYPELCDRENLERLLRLSRARARPVVQTRPASELPLFAARRHGLVERGRDQEAMKRCWEMLFGYPLLAHAWEEEVLPARLEGYRSRWLDELVAEAGLQWVGCGRQRLTVCFGQDRELFVEKPAQDAREAALALFPDGPGRYSFWDLADRARERGVTADSSALAETLWDLAWKGAIANDSFDAVRRGIANGFRAAEPARAAGRRRQSLDRWRAARPAAGLWMRLGGGVGTEPAEEPDALESEEITRDRIRQVLHRHGVIFREILEYELPPLRWSRLFRSLRLLEFSGEVISGRFFEGIRGLQFAQPSALEEIASGRGSDAVWWLNAADPASFCGVEVEGLKRLLPPRLPTTHIVFHGPAVALVSRRRGRELEFRFPADAPRLLDYLGFFRVLTGRDQRPMSAVHVETINGEPAGSSPYRNRLVAFGFTEDYRRLTLRAGV